MSSTSSKSKKHRKRKKICYDHSLEEEHARKNTHCLCIHLTKWHQLIYMPRLHYKPVCVTVVSGANMYLLSLKQSQGSRPV